MGHLVHRLCARLPDLYPAGRFAHTPRLEGSRLKDAVLLQVDGRDVEGSVLAVPAWAGGAAGG